MSRDEKAQSALLPSYEESIANNSFSDSRPGGQRIVDQLAIVRAQHIRSLVDEQICPIIERRAVRGLSQTTIALIPSNVLTTKKSEFASDNAFAKESAADFEMTGLASGEEDLEQVRLEGDLNRFEFWQQKNVVQELQRVLQDRLSVSARFSIEAETGDSKGERSIASRKQEEFSPPSTSQKTRSFFGRKSSAKASPTVEAAPRSVVLVRNHVIEVKAELDEVCLRTVSPFGLYETVSRPALVVRVNVGV